MHAAAGGKVLRRQRQAHVHTHKTHSESRKGTEHTGLGRGRETLRGKKHSEVKENYPQRGV